MFLITHDLVTTRKFFVLKATSCTGADQIKTRRNLRVLGTPHGEEGLERKFLKNDQLFFYHLLKVLQYLVKNLLSY